VKNSLRCIPVLREDASQSDSGGQKQRARRLRRRCHVLLRRQYDVVATAAIIGGDYPTLGAIIERRVRDLEGATLRPVIQDGEAGSYGWIEAAQEKDKECAARTQSGCTANFEHAIRSVTLRQAPHRARIF